MFRFSPPAIRHDEKASDIESATDIASNPRALAALTSSSVSPNTVERLNSIEPAKIKPGAKLPGEFRTLRFAFTKSTCDTCSSGVQYTCHRHEAGQR
jgi:hypothetical protein